MHTQPRRHGDGIDRALLFARAVWKSMDYDEKRLAADFIISAGILALVYEGSVAGTWGIVAVVFIESSLLQDFFRAYITVKRDAEAEWFPDSDERGGDGAS